MDLYDIESDLGIIENIALKWGVMEDDDIMYEDSIFSVHPDDESEDLIDMLQQLTKEHKHYFEKDFIFKKDNFQTTVVGLKGVLKKQEINKIIAYHNSAQSDSLYGIRLFWFLMKLEKKGLINKKDTEKIYTQSIDWPINFKVEFI